MQKVAAYRLERRDVGQDEARRTEVRRCETVLRDWLRFKKANPPDGESGVYRSEDGSKATFRWEHATEGSRSWRLMRADEDTPSGTRFSAAVSVTDTGSSVVVYVSLETGATSQSSIGPVPSDPKCPRYVRELLKLSGDWYHGRTKFTDYKSHGRLAGHDAGQWIAGEIKGAERTTPIVLVSQLGGAEVVPKLGGQIAHDLAGLANVFCLDEDASWALTDELGRDFSCFHGAVRIYWPRFHPNDSRRHHRLWTAERLAFGDDAEVLDAFHRELRGLVMQASALSVLRPREIDEIRAASVHAMLADLRNKASSVDDYEKLADEYAKQNDDLRNEVQSLRTELESMMVRLENAEAVARFQESRRPDVAPADAEDAPNDVEGADDAPEAGDIRFYKKRDGGNHDRMERFNGCNHNSWQAANKADKAKKAIAKLEGSTNWKSIQHCGTCTGGGVYRVTW